MKKLTDQVNALRSDLLALMRDIDAEYADSDEERIMRLDELRLQTEEQIRYCDDALSQCGQDLKELTRRRRLMMEGLRLLRDDEVEPLRDHLQAQRNARQEVFQVDLLPLRHRVFSIRNQLNDVRLLPER